MNLRSSGSISVALRDLCYLWRRLQKIGRRLYRVNESYKCKTTMHYLVIGFGFFISHMNVQDSDLVYTTTG